MADYDLICIGSGSAGGAAAFVAKKTKARVAIVEARRDMLGGHCPNYACVPTKALLHAAQVLKTVKGAGRFGIRSENNGFDFKAVAAYRDGIIGQLTGSRIERNLHSAGIDLLWGEARFVSDHELEVAGKKYSAENILIATGSREFIPPIPGLQETGFWTSDDAVRIDKLPRSVIIVGAGPVGTEFAQIFSGFGAEVTLLQRDAQILQREDSETAAYVQDDLMSRGVKIVTQMEVAEVSSEAGQKTVRVKAGGAEQEFKAEALMVATGRRANLEPLNLEAAGLTLDERGQLKLNEYLQTEVKHIWAAGDAAGNWQFTHTAAYEGDLVGRQICCGEIEKANYEVVPRVTFCEPEVASVGLTEGQAAEQGKKIRVARYKSGNLGRALISRDRRGFVKLVVDDRTKEIYGGHVVGESAGQMIHEIALAMKEKTPATKIARMIHAYPTYSEAVAAAAEKCYGYD